MSDREFASRPARRDFAGLRKAGLRRAASGWFGPFKIKEGFPYREDTPVFMDVGADRPAVVDLRYAGLLSTLKWRYNNAGIRTIDFYRMHRLVMGEPKGKEIHHKNEDVFDNRISNLEAMTKAEHLRHHHKKTKTGVSKTKGGSYMSKCSNEETEMTIGYFDTEEEAALAYDWAARILEGPEGEVNFPDKIVSASAAFMIRTSGGEYFEVGFRKRGPLLRLLQRLLGFLLRSRYGGHDGGQASYEGQAGEFRFLTCRVVRRPGPFFMASRNLILVKTKGLLGYRAIPIEGIEMLYINGKKYKVVR